MGEFDNEKYDWLIKLVIVGDSGVGKTNILLRTCQNQFLQYNLATIGVDFKKKIIDLDGKRMKLQIWDTAGQERFQTIAISYYKGAWGIILVFSITDRKSFENIERWMKQIKENSAEDVAIFLVGNKCDLNESRVITKEEAESLSKKYNIPFYEASAKENINIEEIFQNIARDIKARILNSDLENPKSIYLNLGEGENNSAGCTC